MSFKNGCYASVWEVIPSESGKYTDVRLTTSRKRQNTGLYEQDFVGKVRFIGDANVNIQKYVGRTVGEDRQPIVRLRLEDVSSTVTKIDKQDGTGSIYYAGYQCFAFTPADEVVTVSQGAQRPPFDPSVQSDTTEEELPFN